MGIQCTSSCRDSIGHWKENIAQETRNIYVVHIGCLRTILLCIHNQAADGGEAVGGSFRIHVGSIKNVTRVVESDRPQYILVKRSI